MPKLLTIQIPRPCSEDAAGMLPTANGSYCNSCKKEVIDFMLMSDERIASFLSRQTGHICGRFYPDQLDRAIPLPKKTLPWAKYFFTIAIPAFLFSLRSSAQNKLNLRPALISAVAQDLQKQSSSDTGRRWVEGFVIDENGKPVEAASVVLLNTRFGTTTDQNGKFRIWVPAGTILRISSIGTEPTEIHIPASGPANVVVKKSPMVYLGGAVVITRVIRRHTAKKPAAVEIKKEINEISVFPNPAHAGAELNISWKNKVQSDQLIEVFSADGNLIQKETVGVTGKISACSFVLKETRPGFYIFMVVDIKTGEKMSKEFIVE